jgi:hypothetical protein
LFDDNQLWKAVIELLSGVSVPASPDSTQDAFVLQLFDYLRMLLTEYQNGVQPCVTTHQAQQLQHLLHIPRTAIDVKRRKKTPHAKEAGIGAINLPPWQPLVLPELPPIPDGLLMLTTATASNIARGKKETSPMEQSQNSLCSVKTQQPFGIAKPLYSPTYTQEAQQIWENFGEYSNVNENALIDDAYDDETPMPTKDPSYHNNSYDATEAYVPIASTAEKVTRGKSHQLYDWCPVMDTQGRAVEGDNSFQVGIQESLTTELCSYVRTNGLYSFFKNAVFNYSDRLTKTVPGSKTKTYLGNDSRVYEIGRSKHTKPLWQLVRVPSIYTDMVFVYPYEYQGHNELANILKRNGFDNVLQSVAEHANGGVRHLNILNISFLVTSRNDKFKFHLDFEPTLKGQAWNVIIPLAMVNKSEPELVLIPTMKSTQHQHVRYKKNTAIVLGANQWHSSGKYKYNNERFRYCLAVTVCFITNSNAEDFVKCMDSNYPLRGATYVRSLPEYPQWKLGGSCKAEDSHNQDGNDKQEANQSSEKNNELVTTPLRRSKGMSSQSSRGDDSGEEEEDSKSSKTSLEVPQTDKKQQDVEDSHNQDGNDKQEANPSSEKNIELATTPLGTSKGMSSQSSHGNDSGEDEEHSKSSKTSLEVPQRDKKQQKVVVVRDSSEERSLPSKLRTSPRRQSLALPPPNTVLEDDGFEKLILYCHQNKDKAVVGWDNCVLYGKSFETLQDTAWLCDEIISGYFMLLQEKGFNKKYFFHTMFAAQLVKNGTYTYENAQRYFGTKRRRHLPNIFMYDHVFFPINKGGYHWILIKYDAAKDKELINVYDPWRTGKSPVWVDRITQFLSDEYERCYKNKKYAVALRDKLRKNAVYASCPKQTNTWDCGVYVCLFGYYLAMEKKMNFSPEYVTKYRRTIAKCLLNKKLSM